MGRIRHYEKNQNYCEPLQYLYTWKNIIIVIPREFKDIFQGRTRSQKENLREFVDNLYERKPYLEKIEDGFQWQKMEKEAPEKLLQKAVPSTSKVQDADSNF